MTASRRPGPELVTRAGITVVLLIVATSASTLAYVSARGIDRDATGLEVVFLGVAAVLWAVAALYAAVLAVAAVGLVVESVRNTLRAPAPDR